MKKREKRENESFFFPFTEYEIKAFSLRERFSHFFGRKKRVHVS